MITLAKPIKLRFSLHAVLLAMTLLVVLFSSLTSFLSYHFNWIRQRHAYIASGEVMPLIQPPVLAEAPGVLPLFGERGIE